MENEIENNKTIEENANDFYEGKSGDETDKEVQSQDTDESTKVLSEDQATDKVAKETEEKPEESKEAESKDEAEEIEYKLSLSKESRLDQEYVAKVEEFAKENKLSNESAQALINQQDEILSKMVQDSIDSQDQQIEDWRQEVINDPNLGGDNLKKTSENAKRVIEKFGGPEIIELLDDTGYGNNPHVVKLLATIGEQMGEDSLIFTNTLSDSQQTPEERFYNS